jgi:hypothetical protein
MKVCSPNKVVKRPVNCKKDVEARVWCIGGSKCQAGIARCFVGVRREHGGEARQKGFLGISRPIATSSEAECTCGHACSISSSRRWYASRLACPVLFSITFFRKWIMCPRVLLSNFLVPKKNRTTLTYPLRPTWSSSKQPRYRIARSFASCSTWEMPRSNVADAYIEPASDSCSVHRRAPRRWGQDWRQRWWR